MNGTYINKKRINRDEEILLSLDDKVTFGRSNLISKRRIYYRY